MLQRGSPVLFSAELQSELLPARLGHSRDMSLVRELAEADAAKSVLLENRARPAADSAARVAAYLKLRLLIRLFDQ